MLAIDPTATPENGPSHLLAWQGFSTQIALPEQHQMPAAVNKADPAEHEPDYHGNQESKEQHQPPESACVQLQAGKKHDPPSIYTPASLHAAFQSEKNSSSKEEDEEFINRLQARDQEVRAHEQAHAAALGPYAGPVQYTYQIGPDGRAYAIGGSIQVDMSRESDPASDLFKAQTIERAATIAGNPSSADIAVAAQARQQATEASQEMGKI